MTSLREMLGEIRDKKGTMKADLCEGAFNALEEHARYAERIIVLLEKYVGRWFLDQDLEEE